jgi:hypothetical protein
MHYLLNLQNKGLKVGGLIKFGLGLGNVKMQHHFVRNKRALVLLLKIQSIYPLLAVEYVITLPFLIRHV